MSDKNNTTLPVDQENQKTHPLGYTAEDLKLQRRLLTPLLSKKVPDIPREEERKKYPRRYVNWLSRMFFWWLMPLMNVGYKRTLTSNDLWYLDDRMSITNTYPIFENHLNNIVQKSRAKALKQNPNLTKEELERLPYPKYSVVKALFLTFKWKYSLAILYKALSDISQVLNPLLTKALINFVEERMYDESLPLGRGVGYSIGVTAVLATNGLLINHFLHNSITTGAYCKAILTTALLKKAIRASPETRHKYTSGKVTSLMGTDLARIDLAVGFQPFAITFPIPVIIAIALLIHNIGVSALAGIAVFIVSIVIIGGSAKRLLLMRKSANQYTDKRVGLMREILQSMKMIKFYSWEDAYEKNVTAERQKEVGIIFKMQSIRNFLTAYALTLPTLTSMVAFLVMYGISSNRSPASIFSSLSLFTTLSQQVLMLPMALATGADAMIGIGRVRDYLQSPDSKEYENDEEFQPEDVPSDIAIKVDDATFIWEQFPDDEEEAAKAKEKEAKKKGFFSRKSKTVKNNASEDVSLERLPVSQTPNKSIETVSSDSEISDVTDEEKGRKYTKTVFTGFHDINFEIKKGEFIIVTGPIGSGKSSLLTALAGFMKRQHGNVGTNGSLLLCGQPWVQNATVRENITFGEEFEEERYRNVIEVCALADDLKSFTGGDLTEIGERGINLSGGQKARINLARAVYADKEIILLDDVLSAVDARVGKHIMDKCLVEFLQGKTRILATHQLSLVNDADRVIYLNGDGSINMGTSEELMTTTPGFVTLMEYSKNSEEEEKLEEEEDLKKEAEELERQKSQAVSEKGISNAKDGALTTAEERAVNQISWKVYLDYLKAGNGIFGIFTSPAALLFLVLEVFCGLFVNVWLSFWVTYKFKGRTDGFYIGLYVMFTFLYTIFSSCTFVFMGYVTIRAAKVLNLKAMQKILHAPMSYIDTTPLGRILNRFTKDTDALDNETGEQIRLFLHPTASVCGILILCIIYLPWFAIAIPPLVVIFVCVTNYYQSSSREVKRLEAVKRSFVYNNFNEVLGGLSTIKAYKATDRFTVKNDTLLDKMNEAYFVVIANQRWISIHLDLVACLIALIITLLSVSRQFNISAASAGLVVTYVLNMAGLLSLILRAYTQVENEMNSVERLCHYANNLDQENTYRSLENNKPPSSWPEEGAISFNHVSLRYRDGLPLVLKDLHMDIKAGEKIGICGRTGAGKSSIMTALYRLSELAAGEIAIDGVDISKIGLYDLRSKLSIIPQDPVLFQGSIRKNLDPFGESDDVQLWDALRRSGLIEEADLNIIKIQDKSDENFHKFHLDQQVDDEGANFSLGERQLLALARALVRNSKILILDEATSSVDYETDAKIQATIANEFSHCTILCIAHRLKTILGYNRILVLEQGEIEEFDEPNTLYKNVDGIFRQMCERSDIKSSDFIKATTA